jgi:hypothetical protein
LKRNSKRLNRCTLFTEIDDDDDDDDDDIYDDDYLFVSGVVNVTLLLVVRSNICVVIRTPLSSIRISISISISGSVNE